MAENLLDKEKSVQAGFKGIENFDYRKLYDLVNHLKDVDHKLVKSRMALSKKRERARKPENKELYASQIKENTKNMNAVSDLISLIQKLGRKNPEYNKLEMDDINRSMQILDDKGQFAYDRFWDDIQGKADGSWLYQKNGKYTPMETSLLLNELRNARSRMNEIADRYSDRMDDSWIPSFESLGNKVIELEKLLNDEGVGLGLVGYDRFKGIPALKDFVRYPIEFTRPYYQRVEDGADINSPSLEDVLLDPLFYSDSQDEVVRDFARSFI